MSAMRTSLRALRPVLSSFGNSQQMQRRLASCVAAKLDSIVTELPLKDAFLFTKHDRKWTREDVRKQSQALASGLIDSGCKPGDGIAVWLPDYAEKVACQLAAAQAGLVISCVDPELNSVEAFEKVLHESEARVVIVEEQHCQNLQAAIPEMEWFSTILDFSGKPFRSRKFPQIRYCVHTGFDQVAGVYDFKQMLLYSGESSSLAAVQSTIKDSTPLGVTYSNKGGQPSRGPVLTHKDILEGKGGKDWSAVVDALSKKYVKLG